MGDNNYPKKSGARSPSANSRAHTAKLKHPHQSSKLQLSRPGRLRQTRQGSCIRHSCQGSSSRHSCPGELQRHSCQGGSRRHSCHGVPARKRGARHSCSREVLADGDAREAAQTPAPKKLGGAASETPAAWPGPWATTGELHSHGARAPVPRPFRGSSKPIKTSTP